MEGAVQVAAGLLVHGEPLGPAALKISQVALRLLDHEVHIQGLAGRPGDGPDHRHAKGDVGHEAAVHDVAVDPVRFGAVDELDGFAQVEKVGGQERRGYHRFHVGKIKLGARQASASTDAAPRGA